MVCTCPLPERVLQKASRVPSGDQVAWRSLALLKVSCLLAPVASVLIQISLFPLAGPFYFTVGDRQSDIWAAEVNHAP